MTFMRGISTFLGALLVAFGAAAAGPQVPEGFKVHATDGGWYLQSSEGLALYTFANDRDNADLAACSKTCLETWHLVAAPPGTKAVGKWSVLPRKDGSSVWGYDGLPIYTFNFDTPNAGQGIGDRLAQLWHVVFEPIQPPPGIGVEGTSIGRVLVDAKGTPLRYLENETPKKPACTDACLRAWRPMAAPWMAQASGDWTIVDRADDKSRQWAFRGRPLYVPTGEGKADDAKWRTLVLDPAPAHPAWVKEAMSDFGPVLIDQNGKALYRFGHNNFDRVKRVTCDQACIDANWQPVLAPADAKPVGYWTIRKDDAGRALWAYKGGMVYTFAHDGRPGDTDGEKFAGMDSPWAPILAGWNMPSP